jgi:hypothetical protein
MSLMTLLEVGFVVYNYRLKEISGSLLIWRLLSSVMWRRIVLKNFSCFFSKKFSEFILKRQLYPEQGGNGFARNVNILQDYTASSEIEIWWPVVIIKHFVHMPFSLVSVCYITFSVTHAYAWAKFRWNWSQMTVTQTQELGHENLASLWKSGEWNVSPFLPLWDGMLRADISYMSPSIGEGGA